MHMMCFDQIHPSFCRLIPPLITPTQTPLDFVFSLSPSTPSPLAKFIWTCVQELLTRTWVASHWLPFRRKLTLLPNVPNSNSIIWRWGLIALYHKMRRQDNLMDIARENHNERKRKVQLQKNWKECSKLRWHVYLVRG